LSYSHRRYSADHDYSNCGGLAAVADLPPNAGERAISSTVHHVPVATLFFRIEVDGPVSILRLNSPDGANRLTRACVCALTAAIDGLQKDQVRPVVAPPSGRLSGGRPHPPRRGRDALGTAGRNAGATSYPLR